ncbi:MAG TPA: hypothetical protein VIF15_16710 [Polyangiaceae bacterium]
MQHRCDVNIVLRSGARSGFAALLSLAMGTSCAAVVAACSSGAADQVTLAASGGGPLGGGPSGGDDSSTTPPPGNPGPAEASAPAPTPEGGGADAGASDAADAAEAAPVDAGDPRNTFSLIDTSITNVVLGSPVPGYDPIAENAVIDLGKVGALLSIRVNTTLATVGSVGFALDSAVTTHTENAVPYTLCSDDGAGVITPCTLPVGKHVLVVTPYSLANLGGTASPSTTLYFEIVDGAVDAGGG